MERTATARASRETRPPIALALSPRWDGPTVATKLSGFVNGSSPADSYQRPTPPAFARPRAPRPLARLARIAIAGEPSRFQILQDQLIGEIRREWLQRLFRMEHFCERRRPSPLIPSLEAISSCRASCSRSSSASAFSCFDSEGSVTTSIGASKFGWLCGLSSRDIIQSSVWTRGMRELSSNRATKRLPCHEWRWAFPTATRNESEQIPGPPSERSWRYFDPAAPRPARSDFRRGPYDRSARLHEVQHGVRREQANGESLVEEESVDEYVVEQRKRSCRPRAKHRFGGDKQTTS
jgi:hypothetical protein